MERQFIIPVSFAAALHLGVLFGVRGSPAPAVLAHFVALVPTEDKFPVPEPPPPEPDGTQTVAHGPAENPPPSVDQPPAVVHRTDFTMDPPPPVRLATDGPISTIPGPPGDPSSPGDRFGPGGPEIVNGDLLDNPPRARWQSPPQYPYQAKQMGLNGSVLVEFTVDETGAVTDPRIVRSSDRMFDEPTIRAVLRWRFEPGKRHGRVVRFRMALPMEFHLDGS
jgi:periplasmic protein TonB